MEPIWIIRVLFVLTLTLCGYWVGRIDQRGPEISAVALLLSLFIVAVEYSTRVLSAKKLVMGAAGAFAGLTFSHLFRDTFPQNMLGGQDAARAAFNLLFMYFGIIVALRNADRISLSRLRIFVTSPREDSILLDTSAIIDGRLKELYQMGFITRNPIVPTFVIDELQTLADSRDSGKRHNGRKGLESLENLRDVVPFQLLDKDYSDVSGVDHKLILLAKELGAWVLTTDYNLSKVASLHQVKALNINTIAAALRPTVGVGDQLVLTITREGKDPSQGVGYLEDGAMVVVDDARHLIGKSVAVTVTSMMQTNAGRLTFAKLIEDSGSEQRIEMVKGDAGGSKAEGRS